MPPATPRRLSEEGAAERHTRPRHMINTSTMATFRLRFSRNYFRNHPSGSRVNNRIPERSIGLCTLLRQHSTYRSRCSRAHSTEPLLYNSELPAHSTLALPYNNFRKYRMQPCHRLSFRPRKTHRPSRSLPRRKRELKFLRFSSAYLL